MDYYEELGVARPASVDEVRRAYRNIARLLHPDQQPDETLRRLAGLQMTRLNAILETLTDPVRRREYDRGLRREDWVALGPPAPLGGSRVRWSWLTWLCAALVALGVLVLFLARDTVTPPAGGEGNVLSGVQQDSPAGARANWSARRATPRKMLPSGAGGGFVGEWFYARQNNRAESPDLYPPEYIDLEISEIEGNVKGKYAAKYTVVDRPISPFVYFEFGGSASPPSADIEWSGAAGAAGRVHLTLLSARFLRVEWSTDQRGQDQGLISGTATLLRREVH